MYVCMYVWIWVPLLLHEDEIFPALPRSPRPVLAGCYYLSPVHTYIQAPHTTSMPGKKLNLLKSERTNNTEIVSHPLYTYIHTYIHTVHTYSTYIQEIYVEIFKKYVFRLIIISSLYRSLWDQYAWDDYALLYAVRYFANDHHVRRWTCSVMI